MSLFSWWMERRILYRMAESLIGRKLPDFMSRENLVDTIKTHVDYYSLLRELKATRAVPTWCGRLGFDAVPPREQARARWRELIAEAHPDAGGNVAKAAEINAAWEEAERFYAGAAGG